MNIFPKIKKQDKNVPSHYFYLTGGFSLRNKEKKKKKGITAIQIAKEEVKNLKISFFPKHMITYRKKSNGIFKKAIGTNK